MANLVNSLFKIDAAEGLVRYTNTVKPYHSKILDVLIEYVYREDVRVKVKEKWNWDVTIDKTPDRCVFDVMSSDNEHNLFVIRGHNQERFLAGSRFIYTDIDGTTGVYIIGAALNSTIIAPTDPYTTVITTISPRIVPQHTYDGVALYGTIQSAVTPEYQIIGAIAGTVSPAWIVEGDNTTDFMVGEQVIIANATPHALGAGIYTISNVAQGYVPNVDVNQTINGVKLTNHSPDYNIVGVTPTHFNLAGTVLFPGQWIIEGHHADVFVVGSHFNVNNPTGGSYVVALAENKLYSNLDLSVTATITSFGITDITVVTIQATQELSATSQPTGVLQYPALPQYEIVGVDTSTNTWIVAGQYADRFVLSDAFFVTDNLDSASNGQYLVNTSIYDVVTNTTHIHVYGSLSSSAQPEGMITHPTIASTIISVVEPIFTNTSLTEHHTPAQYYYKAFGSGVLRYLPQIITQVVEPVTTVVGLAWINPITNVSKRWTSTGWVHNYTNTNYSWSLGYSQPSQIIIKSAVSQIDSPLAPLYNKSNSFLVNTPTLTPYTFTATSTQSNQMMFSQSFTVVGVDSNVNKWTVVGDVSVIPGESIYITSSTNRQGLGRYVVKTLPIPSGGYTDIYVTKQISRLATPDGELSVPTNIGNIPHWVEGTRVNVSSTRLLPNPLLTQHTYYFIPVIAPFVGLDSLGNAVETPAVFALSKVRIPRGYDDYVDITTFGTGILSITQDELYVPGSRIIVKDSFLNRNDGDYTIIKTVKETSTTRLYVKQRVRSTTPILSTNDGVLAYDLDSHVYSSLTERECTGLQRSELYAAASITEYIEFVFSIDNFDRIGTSLYENEPSNIDANSGRFDVPQYDMVGYDGNLALTTDMSSFGSIGNTSVHSVFPIGFDTQFFGMGGIDENTSTVAKYYSRTI